VKDEGSIRVLIVDDEEAARAVLKEMLQRLPGVAVAGECANGIEAVKAAAAEKPEAVFLDIEMPGLDGFEVLELLDPSTAVVFVTAFDHYAVKAFDVHAVDYVVKPFRQERLAQALARARERVAPRIDAARLAAAARAPGEFASRLVVRDGSGVRVIPVEKLDFVEARDDGVAVKSEGRKFNKPQTLSSLAEALDPARFLRVHRSFIVNLDRIAKIERYSKNSHAAILADGTRIPISREGHAQLTRELER